MIASEGQGNGSGADQQGTNVGPEAQRHPNISEKKCEKTSFLWRINEASLPLRIIPEKEILSPVNEPERDTSTSYLDSRSIDSPTFVRGQEIGRPGEWQVQIKNSTRNAKAIANKEIDVVLNFKRFFVHGREPVWVRVAFEFVDKDLNPIGSSGNVFNADLIRLQENSHFVYKLGPKSDLQDKRDMIILNGQLIIRIRMIIYKELPSELQSGEPPAKRLCLDETGGAAGLSQMLESFKNLWSSRETAGDIKITCMGKEFKAHRFILVAKSKVFEGMLNSQMNTKEKEEMAVEVADINPEILEALLEFMYVGNCSQFDWDNVDHVCALIHAADKYWVVPLGIKCYQALLKLITLDNFGKIAKVTFLYDSQKVFKDHVRAFYESNMVTLSGVESFRKFAYEDYDEFRKLFFHSIS